MARPGASVQVGSRAPQETCRGARQMVMCRRRLRNRSNSAIKGLRRLPAKLLGHACQPASEEQTPTLGSLLSCYNEISCTDMTQVQLGE